MNQSREDDSGLQASGYTPLGPVVMTPTPHGLTPPEWRFTDAAGVCVRVAAIAPDIIRVRLIAADAEPTPSWAVEREIWEAGDITMSASEDTVTLRLGGCTVEVGLRPFGITCRWPDDTVFAQHAPALGMGRVNPPGPRDIPDPNLPAGGARCHLRLEPAERIVGAGERPEAFDRRGARLTFWNTDPPNPHGENTGAMYASIPFWTIARPDGRTWGVFMDSVARADLDAGASEPALMSFGVASGDLTFFVLAGPTPEDALRQYTELTGRSPLPPRWSLGYGQSRWSYYPDEQVSEIARQFRARRIPCDHLWLDIDYMDGYRVFTWSPTRFPDPGRLLTTLREQGFKTITIIDPGVKADPTDLTFADGIRRDYFIRRPDGSLFSGVVWPGQSVFADFTRADVRAWWGDRHAALLDAGVAGVWDDMNEPALTDRLVPGAGTPHGSTMALDAVQRPDGPDSLPIPHARLHNAYGLLMARATREGLQRLRPDERAFVLTRSGYAGIQRYAAIWTGDNHAQWEHLRLATRMCLGLGMSGAPFVGFDTGGFWGAPTGEMLTRFTQLGALFPFFRNHSARETPPQEPWALGQPFETFIRQAIQLRYRLLPYFYTLAEEATRTGAPITRPMLYHWPDDLSVAGLDDQFTIGRELLAAPAFTPDPRQRALRLPAGGWRDWVTGQRYAGPVTAQVDCPLDTLPLFQREGSIIPLGPVMQYVGELDIEPLTLVCALGPEPDASAAGAVYQDDGATREYERGQWRRVIYRVQRQGDQATFTAEPLGQYGAPPPPITLELRLLRRDLDPETPDPVISALTLDGAPLDAGARVTVERRRYETVARINLGAVNAPFTLRFALAMN
ncbi:MAG TPA: TIM-barrel domain-containing protein [Ktedonobacterales bacterium]